MSRTLYVALTVGLLVLAVGIAALTEQGGAGVGSEERGVLTIPEQLGAERAGRTADLESTFVSVVDSVAATVVQVEVEAVRRQPRSWNPFEGTPFAPFFGGPGDEPSWEYPVQGLGSGVIVRSDGYIVTNHHVVDGADAVNVRLADGTRLSATLVGTDPTTDLAVLRIDREGLPTLSFGDSDQLRPGQWVLAFGSPLSEDLSNSVTAGIVSAVGRLTAGRDRGVQNYIQTDAAINPGNSGGPLVNLNGRLVGINAAIYSETGGYQGIGFSIPANTVHDVAEQLIETGRVDHARLGLRFGPVSPALVQALDLPPGTAQVVSVEAGSPAETAGLQPGDLITEIDGTQLDNYLRLSQVVTSKRPGDRVVFTIQRDRETQAVTVTLGAVSEAGAAAPQPSTEAPAPAGPAQIQEELGLTLIDSTPAVALQLGLQGVRGAVISTVNPGSDAFRESNLRSRMVIVEADGRPVTNVRDFEQIYRDVAPGATFLVRVRVPNGDGGTTLVTALTKPDR